MKFQSEDERLAHPKEENPDELSDSEEFIPVDLTIHFSQEDKTDNLEEIISEPNQPQAKDCNFQFFLL